MLSFLILQTEKMFPKDANSYISWLCGEKRINDYRLLTRYMSISAKIRRKFFGKKIRCVLCIDNSLDNTAPVFFNQLGICFGNGYCITELGIVSMELSCDPEIRTRNSAGILLNGVVGMLMDDGRLVLECGENIGKRYTPNGRENFRIPFVINDKAAFNQHNRLVILHNTQLSEQKKEPADPETIRKIRELYATVLNKPLDIIEEDMDFFSALGGDSLSYFLLLQHIEIQFGIQIKPEERIYFSTARYAAETLKPYIQNKGVVTNNA